MILSIIHPLNLKAYIEGFSEITTLLLLFGPAHTIFSYLLSFGFMDPNVALKFITVVYLIAGFILPLCLRVIAIGVDRCQGFIYPIAMLFA